MQKVDSIHKQHAIDQWTKNPIGKNIARSPEGTLPFFDEIRKDRYENYAPWLLETFDFKSFNGKKTLEIGVGVGTDHLTMAEAGAILYGIDITPKSIELTRRNLELHGLNSQLFLGDAESLPFENDIFDIVYSFGVLHHTPDIQKSIREIYRVLKPEGKIFIALYNRNSIYFWLFIFLYEYILKLKFLKNSLKELFHSIEYGGIETKPLVVLYTKKEIRKLFAPFKNLKIYTRHSGLPTKTKFKLVNKIINTNLFKLPFEFLSKWFGWYIIIEGQK